MFKDLKIGVIGGAGPIAGVLLVEKIIKKCQKQYFCLKDGDFPNIILLNIPFSQMLGSSNELQENSVKKELKEAIIFLIRKNVNKILIACNTLHYFIDPNFQNKIISLTSCTNQFILDNLYSLKNILLISITITAKNNLYNHKNIVKLNLKEQKIINDIILKILSGKYSYKEKNRIEDIFYTYKKTNSNINSLLLGCSEFSVLYKKYVFPKQTKEKNTESEIMKIIDPLEIVVDKILKDYLNGTDL